MSPETNTAQGASAKNDEPKSRIRAIFARVSGSETTVNREERVFLEEGADRARSKSSVKILRSTGRPSKRRQLRRIFKVSVSEVMLQRYKKIIIFTLVMEFKIGHGFDVHRLERGLVLRLGGVTIPHGKGLVAHSDGDVVVHALCDALFGAAAMGDIGMHFPDTSAEFAGIDSLVLLRRTVDLLRAGGWEVGNADCTLMLQAPKVQPFIAAMRDELAAAMEITADRVSVKATTTERLGFVGREEGVAAEAVVLIYRR